MSHRYSVPKLRPVLGYYGIVTPQCSDHTEANMRWDLYDFTGEPLAWGHRKTWPDAWDSVRRAAKRRVKEEPQNDL